MRALLQGGGGKALYTGLWGNLAGVVPASAIFMGIYEPVKKHIAARVPENRNYLAPLGGGALAGLAASVVRVPTEVVKQRLQTGAEGTIHVSPFPERWRGRASQLLCVTVIASEDQRQTVTREESQANVHESLP